MHRETVFPGMVSVARTVVCWSSAFWLFTQAEYGQPYGIALAPFLLFGLGSYLLLGWFLRRPRPLPAVTSLGAALAAAGCVGLLWRCSTLPGLTANAFGVLAVVTVVYGGARACMDPPAAARSISAMEGTTCFFVVFLWIQTVTGMDAGYSMPLLAMSLLSLAVVLYQRLFSVGGGSGRSRGRGLLVVGAVLAAIAGVLWLFLTFGAGPLGRGAVTVFYGVLYCLKMLGHLLGRFLQWLAALFPAEGGPMEVAPLPEMPIAEDLAGDVEVDPRLLLAVGVLALLALAAGVVYLLYRLRRVRLGGVGARPDTGRVRRQRLGLLDWLRRVLAAAGARWRLLAAVVTLRGSPQELYLFLNRAGRRLDCRRQTGETPCAFVRRAARMAEGSPELTEALETLALALGETLYGGRPTAPLPREAARCIRQSFRRALRRYRRQRLRAWLAARRRGAVKSAD